MVKNTKGGNKAKKQARKNQAPQDEASIKVRYSEDPDEVYACCSKLLGNGTCSVLCIDGKERLCIIRNKFRGRGKRGNIISVGTWCLVGRRNFEKPREGKLEKTDLLEVYGEMEKKKLIQKEILHKDKWKLFANLGTVFGESEADTEDGMLFQRNTELPEINESDTEDDDNHEIEDESVSNQKTIHYNTPDLGDDIDINDI